MLVVRVGDLVKDGAISAVTRVFDALWRRRLRWSWILDKITNTKRNTVQAIKAAFWAFLLRKIVTAGRPRWQRKQPKHWRNSPPHCATRTSRRASAITARRCC